MHRRRYEVAGRWRFTVAAASVALLLSLMQPAAAGSVKVRTDPNDSRSALDIRKVITNLTARRVRLQIATGRRYSVWDVPRRAGYVFRLDTLRDRRVDVVIELTRKRDHFDCLLVQSVGGFHERRGVRPNHRSAACLLPRAWFWDGIHRSVRFSVGLEDGSDRAPDVGRGAFVWL
jgi:hypothetical protein